MTMWSRWSLRRSDATPVPEGPRNEPSGETRDGERQDDGDDRHDELRSAHIAPADEDHGPHGGGDGGARQEGAEGLFGDAEKQWNESARRHDPALNDQRAHHAAAGHDLLCADDASPGASNDAEPKQLWSEPPTQAVGQRVPRCG